MNIWYEQYIKEILQYVPNIIFAVNPLPTPFPSEENLINNWFLKDVMGDSAGFPVRELINSSLLLPPSKIFKKAFTS